MPMRRCLHGSRDHSSVAASLCSLALVYMARGRLGESAKLKQSLEMERCIHVCKDHSDVAASLCSLGQVYRAQGRLDKHVLLD